MNKILVPNSIHTRPGQENSEKNRKTIKKIKNLFLALFLGKTWDEIGREREKKILAPNSVHTRPGQENFEKYSKKIQKIKKPFSGIIFSQTADRPRKREKKI